MDFKIGSFVCRKSHNEDTVFKIIKIENNVAFLKGVNIRLFADCKLEDLVVANAEEDSFEPTLTKSLDRNDYFYLPGKILHIDGDEEYLERCLKFYKKMKVYAVGKKIEEKDISRQIIPLLEDIKPDIVIITGHDAYYPKKGSKEDLNSYKNSSNFVKAVTAIRKYEKSHEKLVIIAGACQSNYEKLIKAGANFASSPKRINIHALDPAIIATSVALSKRNEPIDLVDILEKTKYGPDSIGGIITNGLMYVGYPR